MAKATDDLIKMIKAELREKVFIDAEPGRPGGRPTKAQLLVRTLVNSAIAKTESGQFAIDGIGKYDLKANNFVIEAVHGKPTERRETTINVFAHYPEAEKAIDEKKYKVIETKPLEVQ